MPTATQPTALKKSQPAPSTVLRFATFYKQLNPNQQRAVDTIEGPVMVLAGPGTGKTQVLAMRIANILQQTDTDPSSVLALTFTESAAATMRARLVSLIGSAGYYVQISTFHAFAKGVIDAYPEYFPIQRDSMALSDLERYQFFEALLTTLPLEVLRPLNAPLLYLQAVIKAISDLKREGCTVEEFAKLITAEEALLLQAEDTFSATEVAKRAKNCVKWRELLQIYTAYQDKLGELARYDYDDMILFVTAAFQKNEELLRELQEQIQYVLVDEYQDTNAAQNALVDVLIGSFWQEQPNIFVVGDPNQAIYRFQGASIENVVSFLNRYQHTQVISLTDGYRCPQLIYEAAHGLIIHNTLTSQLDVGVVQQAGKVAGSSPQVIAAQSPLTLATASSQVAELVAVVEQIKKLVATGVKPEEIAILYRHNKDAQAIQHVLAAYGVPFDVDGGDNVLHQELIRQLLTFLEGLWQIQQGKDPDRWFEVVQYPWLGLNGLQGLQLTRLAADTRVSLWHVIQAGYDEATFANLVPAFSQTELTKFTEFAALCIKLASADHSTIFTEWFVTVIEETGFMKWLLAQPHKTEMLVAVSTLFEEIKKNSAGKPQFKLANFLQLITIMKTYGLSLMADDLNLQRSAVRLSTVHRAKGQEWPYVFVVHTWDGKWGNAKKRELLPLPEGILKVTDLELKERNEDDRRLLYVALTRGIKQVQLSVPETVVQQGSSKALIPSMFLHELKQSSVGEQLAETRLELAQVDQTLTTLLTKSAQVRQTVDTKLNDATKALFAKNISEYDLAFFHHLVATFKLSVTALNKYLHDPNEFVLDVLLRVPKAKLEHMAFGTAIHAALETLFRKQIETGQPAAKETVLKKYTAALERELLTSADFARRQQLGIELLTRFYDHQVFANLKPVFVERSFGTGWSTTVLEDGTPLTGRIDRVDWLDMATKTVKVIDYKTGKPKSDTYITGQLTSMELSEREMALPETIRGPYQRQLVFYKLLADLDKTFLPTVTHGEFQFVEGSPAGKIVTRTYPLTDEAVSDLKKLILEVMVEIRGLAFL